MTAEMLVFLYRPLCMSLNFANFNQKDRGIPLSNGEVILIIQDATRHEEPTDERECIPVNFCDSI